MHGAAPITQYMAASLSQQIIIYVRAITIRIDVIRNVRSIIIQYRDQPPLVYYILSQKKANKNDLTLFWVNYIFIHNLFIFIL